MLVCLLGPLGYGGEALLVLGLFRPWALLPATGCAVTGFLLLLHWDRAH